MSRVCKFADFAWEHGITDSGGHFHLTELITENLREREELVF